MTATITIYEDRLVLEVRADAADLPATLATMLNTWGIDRVVPGGAAPAVDADESEIIEAHKEEIRRLSMSLDRANATIRRLRDAASERANNPKGTPNEDAQERARAVKPAQKSAQVVRTAQKRSSKPSGKGTKGATSPLRAEAESLLRKMGAAGELAEPFTTAQLVRRMRKAGWTHPGSDDTAAKMLKAALRAVFGDQLLHNGRGGAGRRLSVGGPFDSRRPKAKSSSKAVKTSKASPLPGLVEQLRTLGKRETAVGWLAPQAWADFLDGAPMVGKVRTALDELVEANEWSKRGREYRPGAGRSR